MRSLLTVALALAALVVLALPVAAQDGAAPALNLVPGSTPNPAGVQGCSPFGFDFSVPGEPGAQAALTPTPLGPSEVVETGENFKVTTRLFQVVGPDGAITTRKFGCRAFCPEGEPLGCNPLSGGGCSFCGCAVIGPCICNHIQFE